MNTALTDTIQRDMLIRAPKERVYAALTDPELLPKWFPDAVDGRITPGEKPVFDFGEYGKARVHIVATDPHHYFAYRWLPGTIMPGESLSDPLEHTSTLVEFRLEDAPEGTMLHLLESGFSAFPAELWEKALGENSGGWDFMLDRLAKFATT